ncbi:hypothetical protein DUNSADRAFT_3145 [Dunaliella salina]|uniref:Peptidase M20 dimerisation domain-containing protein n=1 Tax=Dunaliella salina TaxID=3046 RepID=A0ABQ7H834_DUNSA|nr:hypothetical protein DUNSADRAFT_3145 [Dunaliella salina]|eukprot:KAF5843016.1 hypothetical protein DUNSADRAFT_3145 [Dunaliella salina]
MHTDGKGPSGKRPTVLIYGHYDVQPEDPVDSWTHPPFQMTYDEAENYIYGRGVDDDKGGLLQALHCAELGVKARHGEESYDTIERRWHRPTLEIVGMHGGFIGQGMKTIVPHKASAKISCRLVPGQVPDDIFEKVAAYIKKVTPRYATVHVKRMGGSAGQ